MAISSINNDLPLFIASSSSIKIGALEIISQISAGILAGLIFCMTWTDKHSSCEFVSGLDMSKGQNFTALLSILWTQSFWNIPFMMSPELLWRGNDYDGLFGAENSQMLHSALSRIISTVTGYEYLHRLQARRSLPGHWKHEGLWLETNI